MKKKKKTTLNAIAVIIPILLIWLLCVLEVAAIRAVEAQAAGQLPDDEVDALKEIAAQLGKADWNFIIDPCSNDSSWVTPKSMARPLYNNTLICNCSYPGGVCHVTGIFLRGQDLAGVLPPSLLKLPYIKSIDLARNYINGTIPREWALTQLEYIVVSANRLSGPIPQHLGNITTLRILALESNVFSGAIPSELGNLRNLEILILSANYLTGVLPTTLTNLSRLTVLRISGNNFTGKIPNFLQSWKHLQKLEIQASGFEGPIPSNISMLNDLNELRISDLEGEASQFPDLRNMVNMTNLMLRSCNITGPIPSYVQNFPLLMIDLSFNKFQGNIPDLGSLTVAQNMLLTSNSLSGPIPDWLNDRDPDFHIDLSYNNLSESKPYACGDNLNLFKSFSGENIEVANCPKATACSKVKYSLHINCGGSMTKIGDTVYEADEEFGGSTKLVSMTPYWGFSSSGLFWDRDRSQNYYIPSNVSTLKMANSALYTKARVSPLSLTYYARCIGNGNYTVGLHFAEIVFRDNRSFHSLGRRFFDVYIQENLVLKDFNIENEAKGVDNELIKNFTAVITNKTLEIRFHWSGKGTTSVPTRGSYGPLIAAISVDPNFKPPSGKQTTKILEIVFGVVGLLLILSAMGTLWWRCHRKTKNLSKRDLRAAELQTISTFSLKQIKAATNNFDHANMIGEGGFGSVYKGLLSDGTVIAVKQLSSKSNQGNREFLNEMGMISCLQHPNLVKLFGCCTEGNQLLLVYEYLENNCLSRALFGPENLRLKLNWPTRQNICLGIARGLAYLHEESRLKVVHRDIKGTNVLLDENLNPKISDFGLAKLHEEDKTHITTRIAGTIGYIAPEYALWGYLTYKADIYSFGIVALEIVSGKHNTDNGSESTSTCLLEWACNLLKSGNLLDLVDENLESEFDQEEAQRMMKVALLCTNVTPSLRPTMSEVVKMLEGIASVPDKVPEDGSTNQDLRFKAIRDPHKPTNNHQRDSLYSDSIDDSLLARYNSIMTMTEIQSGEAEMSTVTKFVDK